MIATIRTQSATRKRKREQIQQVRDQKLQAIIAEHGSSPLARTLIARLRQRTKYTVAVRREKTVKRSTLQSLSYVQHMRVQKNIKQVRQALSGIVETREADRWLSVPNPLLGGHRPVDKIKQGKTSQVMEILAAVQEGIYV